MRVLFSLIWGVVFFFVSKAVLWGCIYVFFKMNYTRENRPSESVFTLVGLIYIYVPIIFGIAVALLGLCRKLPGTRDSN